MNKLEPESDVSAAIIKKELLELPPEPSTFSAILSAVIRESGYECSSIGPRLLSGSGIGAFSVAPMVAGTFFRPGDQVDLDSADDFSCWVFEDPADDPRNH